ncbi:2TM domain-containing protein [Thalassomonas viridans]|uniref:2TM domain-containing protein n=1 Tax=Thalassomonas viridans TaxID=137584 RepID=A0AAF0C9Z0_9GAMM|nr:2TM domain-containing protein [Thalassomonas viridans]WDE06313.1 2TM domain-containing protein [Thalassomonas viridans]
MIVRKLRLQRGWSQEQLAELSGLSVRTIQRIERGQSAGLESMKSLAAVFEIELTELQQEKAMNDKAMSDKIQVSAQEEEAIEYVRNIKDFYTHLITYLLVVAGLFVFNYIVTPGYIWAWWTALGWGIGVVSHALSVFEVVNLFGADWEKRQVEKRLGRKL